LIINNHERGDLILPHPKKIYSEYKAHSLTIVGEKSLMRCWDFNEFKLSNSRMSQPQHRFNLICNERRVFQKIKTEKPDLYQSCLHPITNPSLDDMTSKYNELYELPENSYRVNEFIGAYAEKMSESEKLDLFQILLVNLITYIKWELLMVMWVIIVCGSLIKGDIAIQFFGSK
jgi:hypothetical protein